MNTRKVLGIGLLVAGIAYLATRSNSQAKTKTVTGANPLLHTPTLPGQTPTLATTPIAPKLKLT